MRPIDADALLKKTINNPLHAPYIVEKDIRGMPTVQPEPQEGHWIPHESPDGGVQYECSRCGVLWEFNDGTPEDNEAYFCPKCGKKLITK
jgi:DNA-directed RNA polymerase subunit RPC12/RpoP